VNAVRNGPFWKDSIIFIVYDEHGGAYDHAKPAAAPQKDSRTPMESILASAQISRSLPTVSTGSGRGVFLQLHQRYRYYPARR